MGKASSIGLGIALARPERKVLVFDGDGSLLMNLGSLVTIAGLAPRNLIHFVFENGQYEVTGGQPIPGLGKLGFARMADGAGFARSYEFAELGAFTAALPEILAADGPTMVCLKTLSTERTLPIPDRLTAGAVAEVTAALAQGA
jgi:sulfopyruvate decarboxylase subunit beta